MGLGRQFASAPQRSLQIAHILSSEHPIVARMTKYSLRAEVTLTSKRQGTCKKRRADVQGQSLQHRRVPEMNYIQLYIYS